MAEIWRICVGMYFKDTIPWRKECNFRLDQIYQHLNTYQRFWIQLLACPIGSGSICLVGWSQGWKSAHSKWSWYARYPWYNVEEVLQRLKEIETLEYIYDVWSTHLHPNHVPQQDLGDVLFPKTLKNTLMKGALSLLEHATVVVLSRPEIERREAATESNLLISMRIMES